MTLILKHLNELIKVSLILAILTLATNYIGQ